MHRLGAFGMDGYGACPKKRLPRAYFGGKTP
jgi:hypothetical protein